MSSTGHINAVSMATKYVSHVDIEGTRYLLQGAGNVGGVKQFNFVDKDGNYLLDEDGGRFTGPQPDGTVSNVSWRTDFGSNIAYPGNDPAPFYDALSSASPGVNTIRIDFNVETLGHPDLTSRIQDFLQEGADRGYQFIIQYSDGDLAGQEGGVEPGEAHLTPSEHMDQVAEAWQQGMAWFELPENAEILNSIYGFELINEPMAYPNNAAGGATYSEDIRSLIQDYGIDWHEKTILVGGLNASAQFRHIDHDLIRDAVAGEGSHLVWSAHLYPAWGNVDSADFTSGGFWNQITGRFGMIMGDDILLTEMQLNPASRVDDDGNGIPNMYDYREIGAGANTFNGARTYEELVENGIGLTYWPPIGRGSSYIVQDKLGYDIEKPETAWMNHLWSMDDADQDGVESDDLITAKLAPGLKSDVSMAFGYGGDDTIHGLDDPGVTNMLYGGDGQDVIYGGAGENYIFGQGGDDYLVAGDAGDSLHGGSGNDTLIGGGGDDWLEGGRGNDYIETGSGNDTVIADLNDHVSLGEGDTELVLTQMGEGATRIDVGDGNLKIVLGLEDSPTFPPVDRLSFQSDEDGNILGFVDTDEEPIFVLTGVKDFSNIEFEGANEIVDDTSTIVDNIWMKDWSPEGTEDDWTLPPDGGDPGPVDPGTGDGDTEPEPEEPGPEPETPDPEPETPTPGPGDTDDDPDGPEPEPEVPDDDPDGPDIPSVPDEDDETGDDMGDEADASGGCAMASFFDDPLSRELAIVRKWRDEVLLPHPLGRMLIDLYWRISPALAPAVRASSLREPSLRVFRRAMTA